MRKKSHSPLGSCPCWNVMNHHQQVRNLAENGTTNCIYLLLKVKMICEGHVSCSMRIMTFNSKYSIKQTCLNDNHLALTVSLFCIFIFYIFKLYIYFSFKYSLYFISCYYHWWKMVVVVFNTIIFKEKVRNLEKENFWNHQKKKKNKIKNKKVRHKFILRVNWNWVPTYKQLKRGLDFLLD